jgi:hypothetical protein
VARCLGLVARYGFWLVAVWLACDIFIHHHRLISDIV